MTSASAPLVIAAPAVTSNNTFKPSSIVGAGNVWNDGLVETYTETWISVRSTVGQVDRPYAYVDPIALPDEITEAGLTGSGTVTLMVEQNATGSRFSLDFYSEWPPSDDGPGIYITREGEVDFTAPLDAVTNFLVGAVSAEAATDGRDEFRSVHTGDRATAQEVRDVFVGGCYAVVTRYSNSEPIPYDHGLRVHSLDGFILGWTAPSTHAPPCRKYPRTDALSNSPRRYPPPKSRQYGNRATGYL